VALQTIDAMDTGSENSEQVQNNYELSDDKESYSQLAIRRREHATRVEPAASAAIASAENLDQDQKQPEARVTEQRIDALSQPLDRATLESEALWTEAEHSRFLDALHFYHRDWRKIAQHVTTRSIPSIRKHAERSVVILATHGDGVNACSRALCRYHLRAVSYGSGQFVDRSTGSKAHSESSVTYHCPFLSLRLCVDLLLICWWWWSCGDGIR
jgi:hypothetical protein